MSKLEFLIRFLPLLTPSHVPRLVGVGVGVRVELVLVEEMRVILEIAVGEDMIDEEVDIDVVEVEVGVEDATTTATAAGCWHGSILAEFRMQAYHQLRHWR